jgi:hypothetical protein
VNDFLVTYLDSIDEYLLEYLHQDDEVQAAHSPSLGDRGRAPSINIGEGRSALERASTRSASGASNGLSREWVVVILGQSVWALREPRRLPRGRA